MRKAPFFLPLILVSLVLCLSSSSTAQNREKFVISAQAGGVNAVTGRATVRGRGNTEWEQLTIKADLEKGDVVRTGYDGRVEMLLNPGSYLRLGENSEFELADNSLENLEVRLVRGTAIVEVTGADDTELLIGITTPHARLSIVRRGLYRVNVVPGDATELIVRKGRVMLEDSHTKIKGGNKVIFSNHSVTMAKIEKADKRQIDSVDNWSKERAETLARANSKLSRRDITNLLVSYNDFWSFSGFGGRSGFWFYNPTVHCYTFLPVMWGWGSPYGASYSSFLYGGCCNRRPNSPPYFGGVQSGSTGSVGAGTGAGSGSGIGFPRDPGRSMGRASEPMRSQKPEISNGPLRERRDN